jgi:hypothetical protein
LDPDFQNQDLAERIYDLIRPAFTNTNPEEMATVVAERVEHKRLWVPILRAMVLAEKAATVLEIETEEANILYDSIFEALQPSFPEAALHIQTLAEQGLLGPEIEEEPEPELFFIYAENKTEDIPAVFWAPDHSGYSYHLDAAGRYTREEALKLHDPSTDPTKGTFMVPVESVWAQSFIITDANDIRTLAHSYAERLAEGKA